MDVTLEPVHKDNSFVPADGGPQGFYERLGFSDTGRTLEEERVWRTDL